MELRITILFDNYISSNRLNLGLKAMWGFSAFVNWKGKNILFDTGSNGRVLLENAKKLGIDLSTVDYMFISHPHWDHIGGWDSVLEINRKVIPVLPASMSSHLVEDIEHMQGFVKVIDDRPTMIEPGIHSTGIMFPEGEQGLILETEQGIVLLVGCSHPRLENMIHRTLSYMNAEQLLYVMGGFHLFREPEEQIRRSVKLYQTRFITPTHCTGETAQKIIKEVFGERFIPGGVGALVRF
jgi:7,8-dihydropterin-6-yl-methyl-4-(beta-D-ribofuranosyl)aminobenzene 5'-phosphate synthase